MRHVVVEWRLWPNAVDVFFGPIMMLVLAICLAVMFFMMRGMRHHRSKIAAVALKFGHQVRTARYDRSCPILGTPLLRNTERKPCSAWTKSKKSFRSSSLGCGRPRIKQSLSSLWQTSECGPLHRKHDCADGATICRQC
jgi:hypothetical protein